jgi:hypothetical protein
MSDEPREIDFHPDWNPKHGEHADLTTVIPELGEYGGADQARVSPDGSLMGGTTNVGKIKIDWDSAP